MNGRLLPRPLRRVRHLREHRPAARHRRRRPPRLRRHRPDLSPATAARLISLGHLAFGFCCLVWGGAHFIYMNLTAPLVPKWLPPSQVFWGYLTGVAFLAAGLAILSRIQARLATILLTLMLAHLYRLWSTSASSSPTTHPLQLDRARPEHHPARRRLDRRRLLRPTASRVL